MNNPFDAQYSYYYDLFYSDKNYDAEVAYVVGLLDRYRTGATSILEYGSGTGTHGLLLKDRGFEVHGLERSKDMAKMAKAKGFSCEVADITTFSLHRTFDACVALFHVISYIREDENLVRVFSNTRDHLNKNGIFIFDVWYTPAVMFQKPETRLKKFVYGDEEITRVATSEMNENDNTVAVRYQVTVKDRKTEAVRAFTETHTLRHYTTTEIESLARRTGFSILGCEEFLTGRSPSKETWGVNFILRAA